MTQVHKSLHIKARGAYKECLAIVGPEDAMNTIAIALPKCHMLEYDYNGISQWTACTSSGLRDAELLWESVSIAQVLQDTTLGEEQESVNSLMTRLYKEKLSEYYIQVAKDES